MNSRSSTGRLSRPPCRIYLAAHHPIAHFGLQGEEPSPSRACHELSTCPRSCPSNDCICESSTDVYAPSTAGYLYCHHTMIILTVHSLTQPRCQLPVLVHEFGVRSRTSALTAMGQSQYRQFYTPVRTRTSSAPVDGRCTCVANIPSRSNYTTFCHDNPMHPDCKLPTLSTLSRSLLL